MNISPQMHRLDEASRTQLISQIASLLRTDQVPDEARQAGLTLIGWLARRMPQDNKFQQS